MKRTVRRFRARENGRWYLFCFVHNGMVLCHCLCVEGGWSVMKHRARRAKEHSGGELYIDIIHVILR